MKACRLCFRVIIQTIFDETVVDMVLGASDISGTGRIYCMLKVKSRAGESVQQMIRRFKKLCEKEGLIRDMKRNAYYEKPSEKNRRRMRKAARNVERY